MSVASFLRYSPALFSSVVAAFALVGCTQTGTYQDASVPDAAKLRFVANMSNATLNYFDAEHCDGMSTGPLNNLFIAESQRRVGMSVAAPKDARGYLEIKLPPEKDLYLQVMTQLGHGTCGTGFNLKPERGAEYEVTFGFTGRGQCSTLVERLQRVDGKDVRMPLTVKRGGFPACYGRNALFPQPPKLLPDTPERAALIEQIVNGSVIVMIKPDPAKEPPASMTPEKLESLISERKGKLGFALPDEYWTLYRQNLVEFEKEAGTNRTRALQVATDEYRQRLRSVDDKQLKEWSHSEDTSGKRANSAPAEQEKLAIMDYFQATNKVMAETINHHLERMAQMDTQYDVCSPYSECWKR